MSGAPAATRAGAMRAAARCLGAAGVAGPARESRLLMQHALGLTREALFVAPDLPLTHAEAERLAALVRRRAAREPIAHITGRREFWSLDFAVDRSTLVPRPETETVVEAILERAGSLPPRPFLLDLGTGSGCLLTALLHELPGAVGVGIDSGVAAVSLARDNARRLGVGDRASFLAADWGEPLAGRFDVIVSNPPYVTAAEMASLAPDVARYEPRRALDGGSDGRDCYRRLAPHIARLLAPGGLFAVEVGAGMAAGVAAVFEAAGLAETGRRRDLAGIERCLLFARKPAPGLSGDRAPRYSVPARLRNKGLQTAPSRLGSAGLPNRGRLGGLVESLSDKAGIRDRNLRIGACRMAMRECPSRNVPCISPGPRSAGDHSVNRAGTTH